MNFLFTLKRSTRKPSIERSNIVSAPWKADNDGQLPEESTNSSLVISWISYLRRNDRHNERYESKINKMNSLLGVATLFPFFTDETPREKWKTSHETRRLRRLDIMSLLPRPQFPQLLLLLLTLILVFLWKCPRPRKFRLECDILD